MECRSHSVCLNRGQGPPLQHMLKGLRDDVSKNVAVSVHWWQVLVQVEQWQGYPSWISLRLGTIKITPLCVSTFFLP